MMIHNSLMVPLEQMHRALVAARSIVAQKSDHELVERVMDRLEILPRLLATFDDAESRTLFTQIINELPDLHPAFVILRNVEINSNQELITV